MEKKDKKISITITPKVSKLLEEGNYNKSKLIDKLLADYFQKKTNFAKKNNIKLLRIPYTKFNEIERILNDKIL